MTNKPESASMREKIETIVPLCPQGENGELQYHDGWDECRRFIMDKAHDIAAMEQDGEQVAEPVGWIRAEAAALLERGVRLGGESMSPRRDVEDELICPLYTRPATDAAKDARIAELEAALQRRANMLDEALDLAEQRRLQLAEQGARLVAATGLLKEARYLGSRTMSCQAGIVEKCMCHSHILDRIDRAIASTGEKPACFLCHGTGMHAVPNAIPAGVEPPPVRMVDCQQCKPAAAQPSAEV